MALLMSDGSQLSWAAIAPPPMLSGSRYLASRGDVNSEARLARQLFNWYPGLAGHAPSTLPSLPSSYRGLSPMAGNLKPNGLWRGKVMPGRNRNMLRYDRFCMDKMFPTAVLMVNSAEESWTKTRPGPLWMLPVLITGATERLPVL
jgi:hypothetical protein